MKLSITLLAILFTLSFYSFGQIANPDRKFSPAELKSDLAYLEAQIYNVHAYPFTELHRNQYDNLFKSIEIKLKDSLAATAFLKLVKPVIAHLCDEHAQASLPDKSLWASYQNDAVFLPFSLSGKNGFYTVNKVLSPQNNLKPGEVVTDIDNAPVGELLMQSSLYTSGYSDQRLEKALHQFGYLYTWSLPGVRYNYIIRKGDGKIINISGVHLKVWQDELNKQTGWNSACFEQISYQKFNNAGYINACSFNIPPKQLDSINKVINSIFDQVQKDDVKYLFIDISKNSGGQSVVGDMLMSGFNGKPYKGFGCNFKKSTDYVNLLKKWGITAEDYYRNAPDGKVFHSDPDTIFPPQTKPNRFKGKVYVIVGNGTFSSAMMMATLIKDNHLATITGETPTLGHPNGFGELYNTRLPNTGINILFGVKQWIRPSGDLSNNLLVPDLPIKLTDDKEALIQAVLTRSK